jgi:hypothetical protein
LVSVNQKTNRCADAGSSRFDEASGAAIAWFREHLESLKSKTIANEVKFFRFRASMIKRALLFKDSKRGRFT